VLKYLYEQINSDNRYFWDWETTIAYELGKKGYKAYSIEDVDGLLVCIIKKPNKSW
jgi:hypothetical protein